MLEIYKFGVQIGDQHLSTTKNKAAISVKIFENDIPRGGKLPKQTQFDAPLRRPILLLLE